MKRLLPLLAAVPLLGVSLLTPPLARAGPHPRRYDCTAPAYRYCRFADDPGWDVYNNTWNDPAMPPNHYTLYANRHSGWELRANQAACPTRNCAVEAYASSQFDYDNQPGHQTIADIRQLSSYFAETMPTGNLGRNGFDAEAAYDIWLNNYDIEVMIWVDNQGQTPAGDEVDDVALGGRRYRVYKAGDTYSLVLTRNLRRGYVDILPVLRWLTARHYVDSSSYLTQFNFGFEICSTAGKTRRFDVNSLSLWQNIRQH